MRVVKRYKHLTKVQAKGRTYWYLRQKAVRGEPKKAAIKLDLGPQEPGFEAHYQAKLRELMGAAPQGPAEGTLAYLMAAFREDDRYTELAGATRHSYDRALKVLEEFGSCPLSDFTRPMIINLRNTRLMPERKRWMANYCVTVLKLMFDLAADNGWVPQNPLADKVRQIRRSRNARKVNRPWTLAERTAILDRAKTDAPDLWRALAVAACTGLRKADLLVVTTSAFDGRVIAVQTAKRDRWVRVPAHPLLLEAIASRPKTDAVQIVLSSDGRAWSESGFDTAWHRFKTKLQREGVIKPGLTIHGLRHTMGHMLRSLGLSDRDIADILGHADVKMAKHYSEGAELPAEAQDKVRTLEIVKR